MTPPLSALAPALLAALAGGVALALGAPAWVAVAAATLGAAIAAFLSARPHAAKTPALRSPAVPAPGAPERDRSLFEALPTGVLVIAPDRSIRFANRTATAMFGLPAAEGLTAATLRAPRLLDRIEAALAGGSAGAVGFTLPRSGDAWLHADIRRLDGTGEVLVAIEDRSQARRAAELHRDFVANASHELKTPLAAVSGAIETLLGHAREDREATERFLGIMAAQVQRMTRLVEDLLSLNRIELNERVAPRDPQDLAAIVAETVESFRQAAEDSGIALIFDAPEDRPSALGDRNELGQLLQNLIDNAIKYGGAGTEVRVELLPSPADAPGMAGIAVSDTGPGIGREHLPRLTERFYRVSVRRSREKGGTGLGLAIVKHIVARHRGRLEIESRPGAGSRFTVWLPLAGPDERAGEAPPVRASA